MLDVVDKDGERVLRLVTIEMSLGAFHFRTGFEEGLPGEGCL